MKYKMPTKKFLLAIVVLGSVAAFWIIASQPVSGTFGRTFGVDLKFDGSDGPVYLSPNSSGTLSWTTTGSPQSCTASGAWSGSKNPAGGSESSGILAGPQTYTYTITCKKDR